MIERGAAHTPHASMTEAPSMIVRMEVHTIMSY
jgi:hypothetical protein